MCNRVADGGVPRAVPLAPTPDCMAVSLYHCITTGGMADRCWACPSPSAITQSFARRWSPAATSEQPHLKTRRDK
eukprot:2422661-Pyramimonas_sp.AAC.1